MLLLTIFRPVVSLAGFASFLWYLYATHIEDLWMRQISKPWPVVAAIKIMAVSVIKAPHKFNIATLIALIFCLAGDVLLEMEDMFLPGLIAFFLGHTAYIYGFATFGLLTNPLHYAPVFAFGGWFFWMLSDRFGDLTGPVIGYIIILCLMLVLSFSPYNAVKSRFGTFSALLAPLGATLFVISDCILAIHKFVDPTNKSLRYANITIYWAAQAFITWGSLYICQVVDSKPAQRATKPKRR